MSNKEEFSRTDPDSSQSIYWLSVFNWLVPCLCVLGGLIVTTQRFAPMMNYDPSVIGKPLFVFKSGYRLYNPLVFLAGIIKFAFDDVYSYYFFQAAPPAFFGLGLAALTFMLTSIFVNSHQKNQHIHGTARWANRKDLQRFGLLQRYGVVCGELENAGVKYSIDAVKSSLILHLKKSLNPFTFLKPQIAPVVCHSGRTNTWMIAPTRAGKGVNSIIPTLLNYGVPFYKLIKNKMTGKREKTIAGKGSAVIFDPKGENWKYSAGYRSQFSVCLPFRPLDPDGNTVHYNPLNEIPDSDSEAFAWADMIGENFFGAEKAGNDGGATKFFNDTARDIFSAVVLHVRFAADIPQNEKNMAKVLEIFSSEAPKTNGEQEENSGCGAAMLAALRSSIHINDRGQPVPKIHELIVQAANRSEIQTPKERASTYSTVFSKISLFQDPLLRNATAYSDFSVDDFINGKNSISLYLIVPYNHITRISPIFRMIINFMIKKFSAGTTDANEVKLKIPCLFLLDEFPVLGYFPEIAKNCGILAGYGVTFFIISQSVNQIVDIYGENNPFFDHCKTIILFAPGNIKDAKTFSETIGTRSVLLDNISASGTKYEVGFRNISRSSQETSTSLINPDELMKMDFSRAIIINQGMPPYKAKKVVYYEDPRFMYKSRIKTPSKNLIFNRIASLPSHQKMKAISSEEVLKIIQAVDVKKIISNDFDIFAKGA